MRKQVLMFLLTFLSSLACFLWATVDLAGRGWLASVMMLGLIAVCCLFLCFLEGRYLRLERLGSSVLKTRRRAIYGGPARQRGGDTSHRGWGGAAFRELSEAAVWTIWSLRGPPHL